MASAHCSAAGGFLEYEYDEESVYDIRPGGASDTAELAGVRRARVGGRRLAFLRRQGVPNSTNPDRGQQLF